MTRRGERSVGGVDIGQNRVPQPCHQPPLDDLHRRLGAGGQTAAPVDLAPLHAKIGQLALENDFLERALTKAGLLSAKP